MIYGFSESHSWAIGLSFAKDPSEKLNQHLSILSTHCFLINRLFFFDIVWGYGAYWYDDPLQKEEVEEQGWLFGGDLGYSIIHTKNHLLSLVLGYQFMPKGNIVENNVLSLNLVYTLRGYFEE